IAAGFGRREAAMPAVVLVKPHRRALPVLRILFAPNQLRRENVMAAAEDVGPDVENFTDHALDREPAAVERRVHVFDVERARGRAPLTRSEWPVFLCRNGHDASWNCGSAKKNRPFRRKFHGTRSAGRGLLAERRHAMRSPKDEVLS